jgi:hypothetical protein
MTNRVAALLAAILLAGCVNLHTHVDEPSVGFHGIRHSLSEPVLHVVQMHGMGNHPASSYCAKDEENFRLQREIVKRLGYHHLHGTPEPVDIKVGETVVGSYTTDLYGDSIKQPAHQLFFSCLTWGDASRKLKQSILELDDDFHEKSVNEKHRAPINRAAKRFVNRSFSDPVIYVGPFGRVIREAVWKGLQEANVRYREMQALLSGVQPIRAEDAATVPLIVLTDSLGSRVLFDALCERQEDCSAKAGMTRVASGADLVATSVLSEQTQHSVRGVFMLANQLPLLELAAVNPDPGESLDEWLLTMPCQLPMARLQVEQDRERTTVVAFTDANDALSYELSEAFKARCAGPDSSLRIVNVILVNARLRWLGLYTNLSKTHASGFKTNPEAIEYIVEGAAPMAQGIKP